jgi:ABC-type dipeptide/oligopeptide/nickel transport system ATPase component
VKLPVVVWIVGEPGVGKTTLCRGLIRHFPATRHEISNPKWTVFGDKAAAAGFWRGDKFDGADTLPISQIKPAIAYIGTNLRHCEVILLDGDKLASANAVAAVKEMDASRLCYLLEDPEVAARRRCIRGTNQNETWVRGRATKARRFFESFDGRKDRIDPRAPLDESVGQICRGIVLTAGA